LTSSPDVVMLNSFYKDVTYILEQVMLATFKPIVKTL